MPDCVVGFLDIQEKGMSFTLSQLTLYYFIKSFRVHSFSSAKKAENEQSTLSVTRNEFYHSD